MISQAGHETVQNASFGALMSFKKEEEKKYE